MVKGQLRSNKEAKKPKKEKPPKTALASFERGISATDKGGKTKG